MSASPRALAVLPGLAVAVLLSGCTAPDTAADPAPRPAAQRQPAQPAAPQPQATPRQSAGECAVQTGEPPVWARGGFSPGAKATYVLGDAGDIVAILFGNPLHAPPREDRSNKILWVAKLETLATGAVFDTLRIEARLPGTGTVVHRKVAGGPGPSIIDLPAAGCWDVRLSWAGHTDRMRLAYTAPPGGAGE